MDAPIRPAVFVAGVRIAVPEGSEALAQEMVDRWNAVEAGKRAAWERELAADLGCSDCGGAPIACAGRCASCAELHTMALGLGV